MADLASLVVKLEAETGRFQASLEKAEGKIRRFEKAAGGGLANIGRTFNQILGSAAVVGLAAFAKASLDSADTLNKLAQSTGIAVEDLSALKFAAGQNGLAVEDLATYLGKLSKTAVAAAEGSKSSAEAFAAIGVSVANADGSIRQTEQLLLDVADQFSQYADGAGKAALAQELFGKSGARLIPFLNQGRDGIEGLKAEAAALGIVISGETAAAAEQLNDNLDKLKDAAIAVVARGLATVVPALNAFSAEAVASAKNSDTLDRGVRTLEAGFKLLLVTGITIKSFFVALGTTIGGVAAAVVSASKGEFRGALEALRSASADVAANAEADNARIAAVWAATAKAVGGSAEEVKAQATKVLKFGAGGGGADPLAALSEVRVQARRKEASAAEQFYEQLNDLTATAEEQAIASYERQRVALDELYNAGRISAETYAARAGEALDTILPGVEATAKKVTVKLEETTNRLTEFQKAAAQNTVGLIADTLRSGFEGGLKGLSERFGNLLLDLAAQAVAADIGAKIFGAQGGGTGPGLLTTALSALGFGGARAEGGPVMAGGAYLVGEQGPELFTPASRGMITPNDAMGTSVTNYFTIQAPLGQVSRSTQMQVAAAAARGVANANRRNN